MKPFSALALTSLALLVALPTTVSATRVGNNASAVVQPQTEDVEAPSAPAQNSPRLPAVSAMMGAASETLKNVNSQASVLEARVAQAQLEDEAKLARQKAVFEQKLKVQEAKNQVEVETNTEIAREIAALKANNTVLKKRAQELQDGNHLMRTELRALQTRFSAAQEFAALALKGSVDTEAPELAVLRPPTAAVHQARHHHESTRAAEQEEGEGGAAKQDDEQDEKEDADDRESDEEDDGEGEGGGAALLSLAARVRRVGASRAAAAASAAAGSDAELPGTDSEVTSPGDLLAVLSKGVAELQKEEKESEDKLKAMFLSSFRAGTRRHATLLGQQRSLNTTRSALQTLRAKLEAADQRLEKTRSGLESKLRTVGLFAQRLAHLALAPAAEVQRLMQALPQEVVVAPAVGQTGAGVIA